MRMHRLIATMAFLPIHEVLDLAVTDDNEPMWNTYECLLCLLFLLCLRFLLYLLCLQFT